ncbi:MAG: hypothetical protein BroJett014_20610 [Planctomycetota bacterium]|nr:hypothetical protein [Planctomycetota bacterium]GIK53088.1 MAG: hypothetical protein BroJett014_20610 [Planctomycetota bacterium]
MYYGWKPYVPAAQRHANGQRRIEQLRKKGHPVAPVVIKGRVIAQSFWGKAWCDNLERYSDFANRLPRGRTYARNGSVIDLQITKGQVTALVSGSEIYKVNVKVKRLPARDWVSVCDDCASEINSLVELLRGKLSHAAMERVCRPKTGLFPEPAQIEFKCSCPDFAYMCKHVAAVLYGIGARLDSQPELLFRLRDVDQQELVTGAGRNLALPAPIPGAKRVLADGDLSQLFGLDLTTQPHEAPTRAKANIELGGKQSAASNHPQDKKQAKRQAQRRKKPPKGRRRRSA